MCTSLPERGTHKGVLGEWSTRDDKGELTREYDLLEILVTLKGASLLGKKNLLVSLVVRPTGKSLKMCNPLGKIFFFFMAHWRTCVDSTHERVSLTPRGLSFSQLTKGLPLCLGPIKESLHDIVPYLGFVWKFELTREFFWWLMLQWGMLLMLSICCGCLCGLCLLPNWGYFGHFDMFLDFSLALPTFWELTGDFEVF